MEVIIDSVPYCWCLRKNAFRNVNFSKIAKFIGTCLWDINNWLNNYEVLYRGNLFHWKLNLTCLTTLWYVTKFLYCIWVDKLGEFWLSKDMERTGEIKYPGWTNTSIPTASKFHANNGCQCQCLYSNWAVSTVFAKYGHWGRQRETSSITFSRESDEYIQLQIFRSFK